MQGAALKAMKEMHQIVHEGLDDVLDQIFEAVSQSKPEKTIKNTTEHHTTTGIRGSDPNRTF